MVSVTPGPLWAGAKWSGPWRPEQAAGGRRELGSRPWREGGREGASGLPESWSTVGEGAEDSRSQDTGDGVPGSHAPPGKAGARGYRVGLVGAEGWGRGSLLPVFLDSQPHLSVPVALTIGPSSLSDPAGSFALSALTARVSRDVRSWVSLEASGAGVLELWCMQGEVAVVRGRAWVRQRWSSEMGLWGTGMWLWG